MDNRYINSPTGCLETKQIEEQDTSYLQTTGITMDHVGMCLFLPVCSMGVYRSKKMEREKQEGREERKENSAT